MRAIRAEIVDFKKLCEDILQVQEAFKQEKWLKIVGFNLNIDVFFRSSTRSQNSGVKISKINKDEQESNQDKQEHHEYLKAVSMVDLGQDDPLTDFQGNPYTARRQNSSGDDDNMEFTLSDIKR